jgi:hypothetical protein
MSAVKSDLASATPLRRLIGAQMLKLSEKTVRAWRERSIETCSLAVPPAPLLDPRDLAAFIVVALIGE